MPAWRPCFSIAVVLTTPSAYSAHWQEPIPAFTADWAPIPSPLPETRSSNHNRGRARLLARPLAPTRLQTQLCLPACCSLTVTALAGVVPLCHRPASFPLKGALVKTPARSRRPATMPIASPFTTTKPPRTALLRSTARTSPWPARLIPTPVLKGSSYCLAKETIRSILLQPIARLQGISAPSP